MQVQNVHEQLLFSTIRIETQKGTDRYGEATGFVFAYESDEIGEGRAAFFAVTNRHVVEGANEGALTFIRDDGKGNPALGQGVKLPILQFEDHWHKHPDPEVDIAVMYLHPMINHVLEGGYPKIGDMTFVAPIRSQNVASFKGIENLDALEEVFFIGYPQGLHDTVNLTPIVRRGVTATHVKIDYEGKPTFLVDAAVFPGSSGSPVFAASTAWRVDKSGNPTFTHSRVMFLGVIAQYLSIEEEGQVRWKPIPSAKKKKRIPTYVTSQALNLGVVYRSSTVVEAIEDWLKERGG